MTRVLVVSDRAVVRAGLRALLTGNSDLEFIEEATSDMALAQVEVTGSDVVLFDLSSSAEQDDIIYRLADEYPHVAVIAVGQAAVDQNIRQAFQSGARGFLLWDLEGEDLAQAIQATKRGLLVLDGAAGKALFGTSSLERIPTRGDEPLSPREREVLHLLSQGLPSKTIAARLRLSEHTVKFHIGSILTKLGASSRTEAVTIAMRRGLIAI